MNLEPGSAYRIGNVTVEERVLAYGDQSARPVPVETQMRDRGLAAPALEGTCLRLGIRPGFDISFYDLLFRDGLRTEGYSEPSLVIAALIDGDGDGYLIAEGQQQGARPIRYAANTLFLHYADVQAFGGYRVESNSRFRMVEMRLNLDFLARLGLAGQFDDLDAAHPFHLVSTNRIWVGSTQMADGIRQITLDLIAMAEARGSDLRIEAGALDLLAKTVDLFRAAACSPSVGNSRHQRDLRCLERARDAILADPAHLWTIRNLARHVGMNEKKLKETFRDHFGQPIRGFQQETRLKRGHHMLLEGASVTETSLAVGFSNPSYFAYLFQRRYGVAPSTVLSFAHGNTVATMEASSAS